MELLLLLKNNMSDSVVEIPVGLVCFPLCLRECRLCSEIIISPAGRSCSVFLVYLFVEAVEVLLCALYPLKSWDRHRQALFVTVGLLSKAFNLHLLRQ